MIGPYNAPWFKVKSIENPELVGWVYGAFIAPLMKGAYPWNEDETTRVINGQISGPMNVITEYNAARGWQSDDAIRIPRGEGPQIGYDINHTRGTVLVFKNIPLSPYLMGAELIATDPLGNEFIHNFQPDEDDYIYEDVYNSQKLDIPAFILAFSPINNSKTGLWHFILTQTIMHPTLPEPEPISLTLNLRDPANSPCISVVPDHTNRNPFEKFSPDTYKYGETLYLYGTGLEPYSPYQFGFYYETPYIAKEGEIEYFPQVSISTESDERGELTLKVIVGKDLPLGAYAIRGGPPEKMTLWSVPFTIQEP